MKKNVMMRVASALLVAVLLTTCAISGTFAKYTTYNASQDTARVAKWGVTVSVSGADAFAEAYKETKENRGSASATVESKLNDGSTNGDDVLAPGTNGTLATIDVNGAPEVDVDVTVDATFVLSGDWSYTFSRAIYKSDDPSTPDVDESKEIDKIVSYKQFYCPLVITFTNGTVDPADDTVINGLDYFTGYTIDYTDDKDEYTGKMTEFVNAVVTAMCGEVDGSKTTRVQANEATLATDFDQTITWAWAFDNVKNGFNCDDCDTTLGNKTGDAVPKVDFSIKVTITQVD